MAITLEEAKKNVQDDLQMGVIDEFQKSNYILEHITFDDAVSPTGGGATPSYKMCIRDRNWTSPWLLQIQ